MTFFFVIFTAAQRLYLHIGIRVHSATHYNEKKILLPYILPTGACSSMITDQQRLIFHLRCKHVSEPETNSSLSHVRTFRNPLPSKKPSISKSNEDQKNLFFGFKLSCIFRKYGVPPSEALHTTCICSIFGYEKLKALLYIRLLLLQCTACKTKLMHTKELRKMGQKANP